MKDEAEYVTKEETGGRQDGRPDRIVEYQCIDADKAVLEKFNGAINCELGAAVMEGGRGIRGGKVCTDATGTNNTEDATNTAGIDDTVNNKGVRDAHNTSDAVGSHATAVIKNERVLRVAKRLFLGYEITRNEEKYYSKYKNNMYLRTEDGEKIGAFLFKPKTVDRNTQYFIICHGKGCDRTVAGTIISFDRFACLYNICFLMIDYRGFADSTGEYTIEGVNYDVLAAYSFIRDTFGDVPISLVGHSLGTAVVLEYGKFAKSMGRGIPEKIFCLAPFTTTIDICKDFKVVYRLFSFFIPSLEQNIREFFNYNSIGNAQELGERLYIFCGSRDLVIDSRHSRQIASASKAPLFETNNNHVQIFLDEAVWRKIFSLNGQNSNQ